MDRLGGDFPRDLADDHFGHEAGDHDSVHEAPPSPVGQDERRMQVRAYNHWASLLGDRHFPAIEALHPETLDDFGPHGVLLDFSVGIDDPAVRFVGAMLAEECGESDAIARLSDVPSRSLLSRITDHYMQILANQAPIGFEAEFVNRHGRTALYRGILLPYSSDNATIDFIFGVINWKEMADQQTADELLEIDQALGADTAAEDAAQDDGKCPVETPEMLTESHRKDIAGEAVLDLGKIGSFVEDDDATVEAHEGSRLPLPSFGLSAIDDFEEDEDGDDGSAQWTPRPPRGDRRGLDALGNPLGHHPAADGEVAYGAGDEDYNNPILTAADYGLPEWDEDEDEDEGDVDGLVDPLADPATSSSLMSLVNRGERAKRTVDLSQIDAKPAMPEAYEGESVALPPREPEAYAPPSAFEEPHFAALEPEFSDAEPAGFEVEADAEELTEWSNEASDFIPEEELDEPVAAGMDDQPAPAPSLAFADEPEIGADEDHLPAYDAESPEGLYDCLAAAREMAQTALTTEDRSRKALYAAVGRAYDFSLEAQANPEDFEELIADNGLTVQDRAPMTPIVKLVFGAEYDKTRLTEYAAVLTHAHRLSLERGMLTGFLRSADGGLKGLINAERRARKEEQGKALDEVEGGIRPSLAKKLRRLDPVDLGDITEDGAEFALVMVRRTPEGELVVLGEVPADVPLVEKAARKLLG